MINMIFLTQMLVCIKKETIPKVYGRDFFYRRATAYH